MSAQASPESDIVRGASRGFTVLLLGGAVQPAVALVAPPLGYVWLVVVAVAAFTVAALRGSRHADAQAGHAVAASVSSYLLVLPVVFMATGAVDLAQAASTSALAAGIGLAVGGLRPHLQGRTMTVAARGVAR